MARLEQLYAEFGTCLNAQHSYAFEGPKGFEQMRAAMQTLRGGVDEIGGRKVEKLLDYAPGLDGLPRSNVLKFRLSGGASLVVRPSGTEPKLKMYVSVSARDRETAAVEEQTLSRAVERMMGLGE